VSSVTVVDETVIVVTRETLAAAVAESTRWIAWWPDLEVRVVVDRGVDGMGWSVSGPLVGTAEVALEERGPGVLVHYRLAADPTTPGSRTAPRRMPDSPRGRRELDSLRRRQEMAWKRVIWALKDEFEAGA
jgi:hypothetical protein